MPRPEGAGDAALRAACGSAVGCPLQRACGGGRAAPCKSANLQKGKGGPQGRRAQPGAAAEGRRPRRSRGALRAGAIPLQRPAEKKKPPPAASEKPFDRERELR